MLFNLSNYKDISRINSKVQVLKLFRASVSSVNSQTNYGQLYILCIIGLSVNYQPKATLRLATITLTSWSTG